MKKLNIIALIITIIGFILITTGIVIQKEIDDYCNNTPLNEIDLGKCGR